MKLLVALFLCIATAAQAQIAKFPFRLNWTASGEHAPFFVARDKGFYAEEGLDVEILDGSGSTTVLQLAAGGKSPVAYADASTMMRGVANGMPVKAVGVPLQQSPHAFIYRADAPRPTKVSEVKGMRIAVTAGDSSLTVFNAFLGKLGLKPEDVQLITVASTAAKDQAMLNRQADALIGFFMDQGVRLEPTTGVKIGFTRLYDLSGVSTLSSAIIANSDWLKDARNQDQLRRFLRATQRGWQYSADNQARGRGHLRKGQARRPAQHRARHARRRALHLAHRAHEEPAGGVVGTRGLERYAKSARAVRQPQAAGGPRRLLHEQLPVGSALPA